jgi:hypothetical protein
MPHGRAVSTKASGRRHIRQVEFEAGPDMAGYWEGIFPGEVPTGADKVLPQLLTTDTIDLEGNEIRIIKIGQADTAQSTVLHIPSLAAVITGDLAYNEVHMMTAECGEAERQQWIANLDAVAALEPPSWSPGTRRSRTTTVRRSSENPSSTCATSPGSLPRKPTVADIVARMVDRYPDWEISARSGIPRGPPSRRRDG